MRGKLKRSLYATFIASTQSLLAMIALRKHFLNKGIPKGGPYHLSGCVSDADYAPTVREMVADVRYSEVEVDTMILRPAFDRGKNAPPPLEQAKEYLLGCISCGANPFLILADTEQLSVWRDAVGEFDLLDLILTDTLVDILPEGWQDMKGMKEVVKTELDVCDGKITGHLAQRLIRAQNLIFRSDTPEQANKKMLELHYLVEELIAGDDDRGGTTVRLDLRPGE